MRCWCTPFKIGALGNTSGQKTKGDVGCVTCMDRTASRRLPKSHKTVYLHHRRFLQKNHPYRKMKDEFDGTVEVGVGPRPYDGKVVHNMANQINVVLGKNHALTVKQTPKGQVFKKNSVFSITLLGDSTCTSLHRCHACREERM